MNTYLKFVKTKHCIETNCNRIKKINRKNQKKIKIYKTIAYIAQMCNVSQHKLQHNTCNYIYI